MAGPERGDEIEAPARFPADEAELAEWAVYTDALLERGDPRGELLARELALPARPDPAELGAWHELARRAYRPRDTTPTAWCLGHARTLQVGLLLLPSCLKGDRMPDLGHMANARGFVRSAEGARIERMLLQLDPADEPRPWRRLFAALPPTCRTVELALNGWPTERRAEELVAALPPSVRELEVRIRPMFSMEPPRLGPFIDDRFDAVGFPDLDVDAGFADQIGAALERTRTVQVRVWRFDAALPWHRCALGRPGDAALLQPERRAGAVLSRWSLLQLQRHYGPIPIRTQLAPSLPESYSVGSSHTLRMRAAPEGSDLVRRGDAWTLRADQPLVLHNGAPVPAGAIVPLADGDELSLDRATCVLSTAPTAAVRRWT